MKRVSLWLSTLVLLLATSLAGAGEDLSATVKKEVENYLATRGGAAREGDVSVGCGKLQIGGLVQAWFQYTQNDNKRNWRYDDDPTLYAGSHPPNEMNDNDTFLVRRAQISLGGRITPEVSYYVMIDAARRGDAGEYTSPVLQDAYIDLDLVKWHTIRVGQFKRPIGREALLDNGKLPLPERAGLSLSPLAGLARDAGIMLTQEFKDTVMDWYTLQVGLFNGAGAFDQLPTNRLDDNDSFDIVERLVVRIFGKRGAFFRNDQIGRLEIGVSRLDGKQGETMLAADTVAANGRPNRATWHYTTGIDLEYRYAFKEFGEFWLMGEWLQGTTNRPLAGTFSGDATVADDQIAKVYGWYGMIGYRLGGTRNVHLDRLELVFRYDQWTDMVFPGAAIPQHPVEFSTRTYTGGINYYIKGHNAKVQAAYSWVDDPNQDDWKERWNIRECRNDVFRLAFQVAF